MQSSLPAGSETGPVLPELSFSFCELLLFLLAQRQPSPVTVHYCAPVPVTWFSTLHTLPHLIHPCQCYKDALIFWIWQIKKKIHRKEKQLGQDHVSSKWLSQLCLESRPKLLNYDLIINIQFPPRLWSLTPYARVSQQIFLLDVFNLYEPICIQFGTFADPNLIYLNGNQLKKHEVPHWTHHISYFSD